MKNYPAMSVWGNTLLVLGLIVLVVASIYSANHPQADTGILLILSFTPISMGAWLLNYSNYLHLKKASRAFDKILKED